MTSKPQPTPDIGTLVMTPVAKCVALRRNPQYVSPHAMEALKASIRRDGFLAPVLLRPMKDGTDTFEIVSGNHRLMAARELGMLEVPTIIMDLTDAQMGRIAVNLNTIHGDPTAELLAPFLAELDDDTLASVHLGDTLMKDVLAFDTQLAARFEELAVPDAWDNPSPKSPVPNCVCPTCGKKHSSERLA